MPGMSGAKEEERERDEAGSLSARERQQEQERRGPGRSAGGQGDDEERERRRAEREKKVETEARRVAAESSGRETRNLATNDPMRAVADHGGDGAGRFGAQAAFRSEGDGPEADQAALSLLAQLGEGREAQPPGDGPGRHREPPGARPGRTAKR